MVKLIAFDLDGTLLDARHSLAGAVNSLRASFKLDEADVPRVVKFAGKGCETAVRQAVADPEIDSAGAQSRMKRFFKDFLAGCCALSGNIGPDLEELRKNGIRLAVVTNRASAEAETMLTELKIRSYFDEVLAADGDFPLKPAPDMLIFLMQKYHAQLNECWLFTAEESGLQCAGAAHWRTALARYGCTEEITSHFDFEVGSFSEFIYAIKGF